MSVDESTPVGELTLDELVEVVRTRTAASIVTVIAQDEDGQRHGVLTYFQGSSVVLLGMDQVTRMRVRRAVTKED